MPAHEINLRRRIKHWFWARGGYITTVHGGPFGKRGEGDLIICWGGQYIWIECKAEKGRAEKIQRVRLRAVRAAGGIALIARKIEDVIEVLIPLHESWLHSDRAAPLSARSSSCQQNFPPSP